MLVLGLSGGYGHDPAAALVDGPTIVAAAEEERFTRRKHAFGAAPVHAAAYCLAEGGVSLADVEAVALAWQPEHPPPWPTRLHEDLLAHPFFRGHRAPPVEVVSHPLAHADVAFRSSGFDEAAVLVVDGQGDGVATTLAHGRDGRVDLLEHYGIEDSIGFFFWALTVHLGWDWGEEGKVMGLAPYGGLDGAGPAAFELRPDGYRAVVRPERREGHRERGQATFAAWQRFLQEHHGPPATARFRYDPRSQRLRRAQEVGDRERATAAWGQDQLERVVCHLAQVVLERTGSSRLVLGGGCAYNCAVNGRLRTLPGVDDMYLFPASGDAGTSVGAALVVADGHDSTARARPVDHAGFGPGFDDDGIERFLQSAGTRYRRSSDVCADAAELIASDRVVGWFQGRMELGPRALGQRSILASPRSAAMRDRVNGIKGRERWRPLAPSLLAGDAAQYLDDPRPAPFMLSATTVREELRDRLPAVVHVDGTCRPQTVDPSSGSRYAGLLTRLGEVTGDPVVLNTSFNIGDEPIVLSPQDALRSFAASGLDALVIGDCIVEKGGASG